jgi:hypothetical protein
MGLGQQRLGLALDRIRGALRGTTDMDGSVVDSWNQADDTPWDDESNGLRTRSTTRRTSLFDHGCPKLPPGSLSPSQAH